jgi:hypothetical protein
MRGITSVPPPTKQESSKEDDEDVKGTEDIKGTEGREGREGREESKETLETEPGVGLTTMGAKEDVKRPAHDPVPKAQSGAGMMMPVDANEDAAVSEECKFPDAKRRRVGSASRHGILNRGTHYEFDTTESGQASWMGLELAVPGCET